MPDWSKVYNPGLAQQVFDRYRANFGREPEVMVFAPGRINLIGEHTDYNNGFVLPSAVQYGIYFAVGKSTASTFHWFADDLGESVEINNSNIATVQSDWTDFLKGSYLALRNRSQGLDPFNLVMSSDLPAGAGMSSSSALTCGVLLSLCELYGITYTRQGIADDAYTVEREFVGVKGGIMDQYASMLSIRDHLLLIDCEDRSTKQVPFPIQDIVLFLLHSNVKRKLTSSNYNTRAEECLKAVRILQDAGWRISSIRDIELSDLDEVGKQLPEVLFKRVKYVVEENLRVMRMVEILPEHKADEMGHLLNDGHDGLSSLYEVSIPEIDFLAARAAGQEWVYGSRLMGGGFGGCTINAAAQMPDDKFIAELEGQYLERFGFRPALIPVQLNGGAMRIL